MSEGPGARAVAAARSVARAGRGLAQRQWAARTGSVVAESAGRTSRVQLTASVPVSLVAPQAMHGSVAEVLAGEYEAGYSGAGLVVLDLGANVGSFSIWASLRWPGSTVHAYEPHPGTFRLLAQNTAHLPDVVRHNAAVFPTDALTLPMFQRYDGDGESALDAAGRYYDDAVGRSIDVDVVHPTSLPTADVVKLDVEGAEAAVLQHLDLSATGLVLLEYQDDHNRAASLEVLSDGFELEYDDQHDWDGLLARTPEYRRELAGQHYGVMIFSSARSGKLSRTGPPGPLRRS